jgi:3-oxoacyl-[acyl-carrier protein] reductase
VSGFADRVAIVTGAASGVGLRATELLVDQGARVVAADVEEERLRAAVEPLGASALPVAADVAVTEDCERLAATATEHLGGIHLLFANAGVTVRAPIEETDDALWARVLDVNLTSAFRCIRAVVPQMRSQGGGSIVCNASINALRGNVDLVAYAAAKTGLLGMVRALAVELAPSNIRVNAICPGTIDTPMTDEYLNEVDDPEATLRAVVGKHPLGRLATADEVAQAALFLGSSTSFVTGAALPVDGGRHIA